MIRESVSSANGSSFYGDCVKATANELKQLIGNAESGWDKCQRNWVAEYSYEDEDGDVCWEVFTIYDFKEIVWIDADDLYDYHIGAMSFTTSGEAKSQLLQALQELRNSK